MLAALAIVAVARAGRLGRLLTVTVVAGALVAGAGRLDALCVTLRPVSTGFESQGEFLRRKAPYHDATAWVNRNLPREARVLTDIRGSLYLERPYIVWTPSALAADADAGAFVRRQRITHAVVCDWNEAHVRQARAAGGHVVVARVTAHTVTSRTLDELGPPETFLVFVFR